eukprot:scaffold3524_cov279-Chaetoceros_neogracile.AAC.23
MFKSVVLATILASVAAFAPAHSAFGVRTALNAEWEPADGSKWVQTDFEKEINKLEKEAEERLDAKVEELKSNIASVGK